MSVYQEIWYFAEVSNNYGVGYSGDDWYKTGRSTKFVEKIVLKKSNHHVWFTDKTMQRLGSKKQTFFPTKKEALLDAIARKENMVTMLQNRIQSIESDIMRLRAHRGILNG